MQIPESLIAAIVTALLMLAVGATMPKVARGDLPMTVPAP